LGLLFFQEASLLGFIANLIAIPLTGFIVLPLCLLGDIFYFIIPPFSQYIFVLAERALEFVWLILTKISEQQGMQWHISINNLWIFFSACLAIILLLAPRKFPARFFGLAGLLPLILWTPQQPLANELWFSLLDVGKGFSALVQTQHTALLFDTGNHSHSQLNSANAVIIPFLLASHINTLNMLVVSDADNSHMGGTESLLKNIHVDKILTTIPYYFFSDTAKNCYAGQEWNWDGVQYQMLYPEKNDSAENNACVLKISTAAESILLLGDVGKKGLKDLLKKSPALLKANIVVIPHITHAADLLSQFIQLVHPAFVLFPESPPYFLINNNQNIQKKINYYTTQDDGDISFKLNNKKENLSPIFYRKKHFYFWNQ
jgi:competence protein ComEC